MENIELHRFHGVQITFQSFDGLEVAGHIDQQPAPGKARTVFDDETRCRESLRADLYQLQKSLQAMEDSQRVGCLQLYVGRRDLEPVGFVFA